jgi:hypothetical protein
VGFIIGILTAAGLVTAVTIHILTFYPDSSVTSDHPLFFLMHVGAIASCGALALALRKRFGTVRPGWRDWLSIFPRWGLVLIVLAMAYTGINFQSSFREGGTAEIRNGQYVLMSHGTFLRALTQEEYQAARAHVTRGFSGHWILFYLIPTLYFLFGSAVGPDAQAERRSTPSGASR